MFMLKKEETISRTFRMPKSLVENLEKLADEEKLSLSKVVIQCCEYALGNMKQEKSTD